MFSNEATKRRNVWLVIGIVLAIVLSVAAALMPRSERPGTNTSAEQARLDAIRKLEQPQTVETKTLTGTVKGVYGATIHLELIGSSDTSIRFASVLAETTYSLVNTKKLTVAGNPTVTTIKLSDIKPGDTVTVTSDEFVGTAKKFDVTEVQKVL
jgi:hypothetical protein